MDAAKCVDRSLNYVDKVIRYGSCVTTVLCTEASQINLCGAFVFLQSKMIREFVVVMEVNF
jgi:hypothetical protein